MLKLKTKCQTNEMAVIPHFFTAGKKMPSNGFWHWSSDFFHFFSSWVSNPMRIASVAPSSAALSRLITQEIDSAVGPVIELGPGTGVFTKSLLARGVAESDLTLVEFESAFVKILQKRFSAARVLQMDATELGCQELFPAATVGAVISGLPLLSMSPQSILRTLAGAFAYLRPGAGFYQFTYGFFCPVDRVILDRLGLKATRVGSTLWNFPPASVYRITRRRPFPQQTFSQSKSPEEYE